MRFWLCNRCIFGHPIEERKKSAEDVSTVTHTVRHPSFTRVIQRMLLNPNDNMECQDSEEIDKVESFQPADVAVAVGKGESSVQALKWTLETIIGTDHGTLHLLHVQHPLRVIQTPLGYLPFEQANEECQRHAKQQRLSATKRMLQRYLRMCEKKKVNLEVHCVESSSIPRAIVEQVSKLGILKLVLGSSSKFKLRKLINGSKTAPIVAQNVPDFCAVMVIRNGRLSSVKDAWKSILSVEDSSFLNLTDPNSSCGTTATASGNVCLLKNSKKKPASLLSSPRTSCSLPYTSSSSTETSFNFDTNDFQSSNAHRSGPMRKLQYTSKDLRSVTSSNEPIVNRSPSRYSGTAREQRLKPEVLDISCGVRGTQQTKNHFAKRGLNQDSQLKTIPAPSISKYQYQPLSETGLEGNKEDSLAKCKEVSKHVNERLYFDGVQELKSTLIREVRDDLCIALHQALKVREDNSLHSVIDEREKIDDLATALSAAKAEAHFLREELDTANQQAAVNRSSCSEALIKAETLKRDLMMEVELRKLAEKRSWKAKKDLMKIPRKTQRDFVEYSFEDLESATNNFSEDHKVGEGGYGGVYKGVLNDVTVAVKVLRKGGKEGEKQFQHEVKVLSYICHPHIVDLIGACKDQPCVVYEYMENGSLEDRLSCKNGTSPIAWQVRFKICFEIALALVFLHNLSPNPIVHRDLKPGNILLDKSFVSKLSDAGLARWIPKDMTYNYTEYRETKPAGTFAYMDPEYIRTGTFGPHSDVFALGIVILQLVTGKTPLGVVAFVEKAIDQNRINEILDLKAGDWPLPEAQELAKLGVLCAESRRRDRPSLDSHVLPILKQLYEAAYDGAAIPLIDGFQTCQIPNSFICPLSQEIMRNPHVAADGFTYEFVAIKNWIAQHDVSPMTNLRLAHKQLTKNCLLESKIRTWKQDLRQS